MEHIAALYVSKLPSASYRRSMFKEENRREKKVKAKSKSGKGKRENGDRRRSIFLAVLLAEEICPDLQKHFIFW